MFQSVKQTMAKIKQKSKKTQAGIKKMLEKYEIRECHLKLPRLTISSVYDLCAIYKILHLFSMQL